MVRLHNGVKAFARRYATIFSGKDLKGKQFLTLEHVCIHQHEVHAVVMLTRCSSSNEHVFWRYGEILYKHSIVSGDYLHILRRQRLTRPQRYRLRRTGKRCGHLLGENSSATNGFMTL